VAAARRELLPPLQSVMELTSAFQPPTRGQAPVSAQAAPSSAGARTNTARPAPFGADFTVKQGTASRLFWLPR
jgi:hypothetical protein